MVNVWNIPIESCDSEGSPAPAMAAIFSTVSNSGDWFSTTSGVVGGAETNSKQQGNHLPYTLAHV